MENELEWIWKEGSWPNQSTILAFAWKDLGKPQKTKIRIAVTWPRFEISTSHIWVAHYVQTTLFHVKFCT
jgi:hypothetical protein